MVRLDSDSPLASKTSPPLRLITRYVGFAERRAGLLVALLALVTLGGLSQAVHLGLNTDMTQLLASTHPGVTAFRRLAGRQKTSTNLVLLFGCSDSDAARAAARAV